MNATHAHGASRDFYETMSQRELHPHTIRGITYRNLMVARQVPRGAHRVLEVGPGEGWLSRILSARGHDVTAVDLASGWLRRLEPGAVRHRAAAAMTQLPFAEASFDAVIAAEVVEHIPDLAQALREAARILVPGGTLVVTVPYRETLKMVVCEDCGERYEVNGHLHTFDRESLVAHLHSAGLKTTNTFVGPTRFSREILRRAPIAPLLPLLNFMDTTSYRLQRVSDTWLLAAARRV